MVSREAAEVSVELAAPLAMVCHVLGSPRSTVYARRAACPGDGTVAKRGPKTTMDDDELLALIRQVIKDRPFCGGGHRQVTARLLQDMRDM